LHCPSIWESTLSNRVGKSVPGLVLAIWADFVQVHPGVL
jgi:hypothetical protein